IADQSVRFTRPALVEQYFVTMDGLQQDFVIPERPIGTGELTLRLAVLGAEAQQTPYGALLVLEHSRRKIAYSGLRVTDATGKELNAHMEVPSGADEMMTLKSNSQQPTASLTVVV